MIEQEKRRVVPRKTTAARLAATGLTGLVAHAGSGAGITTSCRLARERAGGARPTRETSSRPFSEISLSRTHLGLEMKELETSIVVVLFFFLFLCTVETAELTRSKHHG